MHLHEWLKVTHEQRAPCAFVLLPDQRCLHSSSSIVDVALVFRAFDALSNIVVDLLISIAATFLSDNSNTLSFHEINLICVYRQNSCVYSHIQLFSCVFFFFCCPSAQSTNRQWWINVRLGEFVKRKKSVNYRVCSRQKHGFAIGSNGALPLTRHIGRK